MQAIMNTTGVLVLVWVLGFAALTLWTHGYLSRRRWSDFTLKAIAGSLCGLLALGILVLRFGGTWGDVGLGVGIVVAVFAVSWGLVAVFDR